MMSARLSARSQAKLNAEKRLVRQREKEHEHRSTWGNRVNYYKTWEKNNTRYEEWTLPRYYETNNQTIETHKKKLEREENLHKRRDKLRSLLEEERRSHDIEVMVKNRHAYEKPPAISTEELREISAGLKVAEEERKRNHAELGLYQQWRSNNSSLKEHERALTSRNLKLNWLDQQVEKRIQKEKDEKEYKTMVEERNRRLRQENELEEQLRLESSEKNAKLRADLEKQVEDLRIKQENSDKLRRDEEDQRQKLTELAELQRQQDELKRLIADREMALQNLKQHKLRLKQKAIDVRHNLEEERAMVQRLIDADILDKMADDAKKAEIQKAAGDFLKFAREQQELEKKRERHFDFIFDSEAKSIYEKQREIWIEEEFARSALIKDVFATVKEQVEERVKTNKLQQRQALEERQNILKSVEEYEADLSNVKAEEQKKRDAWKADVEEQIKEKRARERQAKLKEEGRIDLEIQAAKREEERLRHEIAKMQQKCGPIRPPRSRIFL